MLSFITIARGTTLSEQEFLDSVKEPGSRDVFVRLMVFAKEFGHVHCATRSVNARMPFHNTGDVRFFRLFTRGTIGTGRLDGQLRKRGLPDDLAWSFAKNLAALFPGVGLKPDKPDLARKLKASEVAPKFDEFISVYHNTIDQLKTMTPTLAPVADDEDPEEEEDVSINKPEDIRR